MLVLNCRIYDLLTRSGAGSASRSSAKAASSSMSARCCTKNPKTYDLLTRSGAGAASRSSAKAASSSMSAIRSAAVGSTTDRLNVPASTCAIEAPQ